MAVENPYADMFGSQHWLEGFEAGRASRDAEIESLQTWNAALHAQLAENDAELEKSMRERDGWQERVDAIATALGDKTEWSNLNDRGYNATVLAAELHIALAEKEAEFARLQDRAEFDATDGAHPAWWRGHDRAEAKFRELIAAKDALIANREDAIKLLERDLRAARADLVRLREERDHYRAKALGLQETPNAK